MSESEGRVTIDADLASAVVEAVFITAVETGQVVIADRPAADILAEFYGWVGALVVPPDADPGDTTEFSLVIDHRSGLLDQAEQHAAAGQHALAVVLYATWIEHSVNALISRALERKDVSEQSTRALLRAVNLDPKITALWELAGIPAMAPDLVKSIRRIANLRNEFLHYKWLAEPDDPHAESSTDRYEAAMDVCAETTAAFSELAESFLWEGRRDEILAAFRGDG